MKTLEAMLAESMTILRDRPGLNCEPGLLPRGGETFDWRVVSARLMERGRKERAYADGLTAERDRAVALARADVFGTAALEVEAEAKRKGLL